MTLTLPAGTNLDDRYEILSVAGSGGMGTVYRAKQIGLGREVAVKVLDPALLGEGDNYERFEREAKSISLVQHEHIATFYNFGVLNSSMPYLAMEYLDGPSLRQTINDETPMAWQRAFEICAQICEGMEAAHQAGVVHRDLKPNNVILMNRPHADFVKIVDFGLAKLSASTSGNHKLTVTGQLIGSVNYLSPEQCLGRQSDERSDIYSLGCILYELLCGVPPFDHENPVAMLHAHMSETPIKPSKRLDILKKQVGSTAANKQSISGPIPGSGEISKQIKKRQLEKTWLNIDAIVSKALAKDPQNRYASMKEFEHDLRALLTGEQENLVATTGPIVSDTKSSASSNAFQKTAAVSFALLLAVAGGVASWLYLSDDGKTQRSLLSLKGNADRTELIDVLAKSEKLKSDGKLKLSNQLKQAVELTVKRNNSDPLALGSLYLDCAKKFLKSGDKEGAREITYDTILALIRFDSKDLSRINDHNLKEMMEQTVSIAKETQLTLNRTQMKELQFLLGVLKGKDINFNSFSALYDLMIESSSPKELVSALLDRAIGLTYKGLLTPKIADQVLDYSRKAYGKTSPEVAHNCVYLLKTMRDYNQRESAIYPHLTHQVITAITDCKTEEPTEKLSMLFDAVHIAYDFNYVDDARNGTKQIEKILSTEKDYGPTHAEMDLLFGRLEHANKNYKKSSKYFERAIGYAFETRTVRYDTLQKPVLDQADNLEHLGKDDEAVKLIQTFLKKSEEMIDGAAISLNPGSRFYHDTLANSGLLAADFFASNEHPELVIPTVLDSIRVCHKYELRGVRTLWSLRKMLLVLDARKQWSAAIPYLREMIETDDSFFSATPETISSIALSSIYGKMKKLDPLLYGQTTEKIVRVLHNAIEKRHTSGLVLSSVIARLAENNEKEAARKLLKEALNELPENDDEYLAIKKQQSQLEMLVR